MRQALLAHPRCFIKRVSQSGPGSIGWFLILVQKRQALTDLQPLADKHLATIETSAADNWFQLKLKRAIMRRLWRRNHGKHTQDACGACEDRSSASAGSMCSGYSFMGACLPAWSQRCEHDMGVGLPLEIPLWYAGTLPVEKKQQFIMKSYWLESCHRTGKDKNPLSNLS